MPEPQSRILQIQDSCMDLTTLARQLLPKVLRRTIDENDVVQEAVLRILKSWKLFSTLDEPARHDYTRKTVRRLVFNFLRRSRIEERVLRRISGVGRDSLLDLPTLSESRPRLIDYIDRLPSGQREAIKLVFAEGLTPRQAALTLCTTRNALDQRIHKGIQALRRMLTALPSDYDGRQSPHLS